MTLTRLPRSRSRRQSGPVTSRVLLAALAVVLLAIRPGLGRDLLALAAVITAVVLAAGCAYAVAIAARKARPPARVIIGRVCVEWLLPGLMAVPSYRLVAYNPFRSPSPPLRRPMRRLGEGRGSGGTKTSTETEPE